MAQDVAILDFGSGKITVLVGRRGVNNTICISGMGECDYAGFTDGEFLEPEQVSYVVGHAIANAETNSRTKVKHLFIGVPGEFTAAVCREASLSLGGKKRKITDADIDALHEQGDSYKNNPDYTLINSQPVYYTLEDGRRLIQPVGLPSAKIGGLISYILGENKFISFIDGIMRSLGIESYDYISSLLAETLFLFDDVVRDKFVVLIDCGYITTNVVVARGDGILAQYNIPLGGGYITGDLAMYLNISFSQAEALKRKVVLSLNVGEEDKYQITANRSDILEFPAQIANEIVAYGIKKIADTVAKCLKECPYDYPDYIPYHLTGGGLSYMKGARELLSKHLTKPVEVVAPRLPQFNRPHLSASLGLLDMVLSLQPPEEKKGFFAKLFGKK
ncbi:MAG: hypothetical protein FWE82_08755 [Defluviitaleaceae bacterium]|nr:hypothetical protein [Defluviitaleaceae bacterium]